MNNPNEAPNAVLYGNLAYHDDAKSWTTIDELDLLWVKVCTPLHWGYLCVGTDEN